jgi:hypothetical protein
MKPFRRRQFETEMDAELRFHISARTDDLIRDGLPQEEAERLARAEFGGVECTKEERRRSWGLHHLDDLRADLRLTLRMLGRNRGFAAVAILSLALGIGANTAIFGLVDAVMLRALPVHDPDSLVFLQAVGWDGPNGGPPYPCFEWLRDKTTSFEGVAAFSRSAMELAIDGRREQVSGVWVSGNLYSLLGVRPLIGRVLSAADDRSVGVGGPDGPGAVISHTYWERRFGRDPAVVGRSIRIFDHAVVIVGVLPAEGMSPDPGRPIDIAVPMTLSDPVFLQTMDRQIELTLLRERLVTTLSMAFGGLAPLLACVGLYGTLAYTVARRTHELGIRIALGATRTQAMWLVLQGLTVSVIGIAIGVPAVLALGRIIRGLLFGVEPLDPLALGATAVLLVTFTIVAGLGPARRAGALDPMVALRAE